MLILIIPCRDSAKSADDNIYAHILYFKIDKIYINIILSPTFATLGKMLSDRTSQSCVKSAY